MNFKGHAIGGICSASAITAVSLWWRPIKLTVADMFSNPASIVSDPGVEQALAVWCITWLMSLFPDLDTASYTQRWTYRFLLFIGMWLFLLREFDLLAIMCLVSYLPLIDKHRGITHHPLCSPLICFTITLIFDSPDNLLPQTIVSSYVEAVPKFGIYWMAILGGHYTHLLLDKIPRSKKRLF